MKRTTLIITTALLIFVAAVFLCWDKFMPAHADEQPANPDVELISGFYRAYILQQDDMRQLGDSLLSEDLLNDLRTIAAWEDSTEFVVLDADPFLAAQDFDAQWAETVEVLPTPDPDMYGVRLHGDTILVTLLRDEQGRARIHDVCAHGHSVRTIAAELR